MLCWNVFTFDLCVFSGRSGLTDRVEEQASAQRGITLSASDCSDKQHWAAFTTDSTLVFCAAPALVFKQLTKDAAK